MAFFEDDRVTTVSVHEDYRWPYSGTSSYPHERAFNLPVPREFNDSELEYLLEQVILPLANDSRIDAFVICCGADSLAGDPITHLRYTEEAHAEAAAALCRLADKHCEGRIIGTGGGGYNRRNLARAWTRVVQSFVEAG